MRTPLVILLALVAAAVLSWWQENWGYERVDYFTVQALAAEQKRSLAYVKAFWSAGRIERLHLGVVRARVVQEEVRYFDGRIKTL